MLSLEAFPFSEVTKIRLKGLYPDFLLRVVAVLNEMYKTHNYRMGVADGVRSFEKQRQLYAQGRTAPGPIVTNAKPGYSFHAYGLAADCAFLGTDPFLESLRASDSKQASFLWSEYGKIAKQFGLIWGGDFRLKNGASDSPHIECSYGFRIDECLQLYKGGGVRNVWHEINKQLGVSDDPRKTDPNFSN